VQLESRGARPVLRVSYRKPQRHPKKRSPRTPRRLCEARHQQAINHIYC